MGSLAIENVDVFDGQGVSRGQTVVVKGSKVFSLGSCPDLAGVTEVIDGRGKTLLPGLFDSHVHIEGEGSLKQSLAFGVTTVLDMFCDYRTAAELRKFSLDEGRQIADLFSAGTLVTAPNGHGTEYELVIPTLSGREGAHEFVDARISEGSDYIKIVYDDGGAYGRPFPTIDRATLEAVISASHDRGRLAIVHTLSLRFAQDSIESGADGLVHLFFDKRSSPEFVKLMQERRPFVIPTLAVLESVCGIAGGATLLAETEFSEYLDAYAERCLKLRFGRPKNVAPDYAVPREAIALLKKMNIPILAGTDSPNPGTTFGASIHRELELLVEAGLTPTEALASATSVPADAFGIRDRGMIAPGQRADLLMVRGDPTRDIKLTRTIESVWRLGSRIDRDAYRRSLDKG